MPRTLEDSFSNAPYEIRQGFAGGNAALSGTGGGSAGMGGAIFNQGSLTIEACTLADNSAVGGAGGSYQANMTGRGGAGGGGMASVGQGANSSNNGGFGGGTGGGTGGNSGGSYGTKAFFLGGGGGAGANHGIGGAGGFGGGGSFGYGGGGAGMGGAVFNEAGTVVITNSTLAANTASGGAGGTSAGAGAGLGGGLFNHNGTITVSNSTISGNTAVQGGRGIFNFGDSVGYTTESTTATATITNTIIGQGSDIAVEDFTGMANEFAMNTTAGSNNLIRTSSGFAGAVANTADPKLGPLQNNGGPTQTMALLSGSPAIDAGNPAYLPPPDFDQRGAPFARVFNGRIDIGAYEASAIAPPSANFDGDLDVDGHDFLRWQRGLGTPGALKSHGDADNDQDVDGADLAVWKSQFGTPPPAEPALAASASPSFSETRIPVAEKPDNSAADAVFAAGDFTQLFAASADDDTFRRSYRPRRRR